MARRAEPLRPSKLPPRPERVAAFQRGLSAESRAALLLIAKAYRILERRWKTPFGEIDIVARRRGVVVFVEVKARGSIDEAVEAVTNRTNGGIRFDVIVVTPGKMPRHIVNAFIAEVA